MYQVSEQNVTQENGPNRPAALACAACSVTYSISSLTFCLLTRYSGRDCVTHSVGFPDSTCFLPLIVVSVAEI